MVIPQDCSRARDTPRDGGARAISLGGISLVQLGERELGLEWARRAVAIDSENPLLFYSTACVYSLANEVDDAVNCLERAVELGFSDAWLKTDPDLNPIRDHPRFQALMKRG